MFGPGCQIAADHLLATAGQCFAFPILPIQRKEVSLRETRFRRGKLAYVGRGLAEIKWA